MQKIFYTTLFLLVFFITVAQNPAPEATTSGTLTVTATTSAANGGYQPSNIVAIWVQNSSGTFVKTLMAYAATRVNELTSWVSNSAKNKVDAITGATLNSHGIRIATWNGTNASKVAVADGTYTIKMELADGGSSKVATYTIVKGTSTTNATPVTTSSCFSNVTIQWVPSNTAVNNIELSNQYSVYPNPTRSTVYVNGFDIDEIELVSINGKSMLVTDNQRIDLSTLPKGIYFAKITTKAGICLKKIEKL